jgi:hypothetical protein
MQSTLGAFVLAALALSCGAPSSVSAASRPAACAFCEKPIPAGGGVQATVGGEARVYRCIHCALTDIRDEPADVVIEGTTPLDGVAVRLTRHAGVWQSSPPTTVFLILPERAGECLALHQPFADLDEFERYLAAHPEIAEESPEAYPIARYDEIVRAGKPR